MPVQTQESFYQHLFRSLHRRLRVQEGKPTETAEAVSMLREYTGLSWEDFARMIGVQPSTAASIVRRNSRLDVSVCAACRRLAREFHLPKLTDWFDKELLRLVRTQRNRRDSGIGSENRKYYDEIR